MSDAQKYYGKYRGTVLNNIDPMQMGRLQVQVPDVAGLIPTSWAMPCFPASGKQMGAYMLPQIGAGVWVEFEQGNMDYPIGTSAAGTAASPKYRCWRSLVFLLVPTSCSKRRRKTRL